MHLSFFQVSSRCSWLVSGLPCLPNSLYLLIQDFLLNILYLHPPTAIAYLPGPLEDSLPSLCVPPLRRKERPCCRHSSPQPDSRTSEQPVVVSNGDIFSTPVEILAVYSGAVFCVTNTVSILSAQTMCFAHPCRAT